MTPFFVKKFGLLKLSVLLSVLVLTIIGTANQIHRGYDMAIAATMTNQMKRICVGRFSIDVPTQASVSFSHEAIDGFEIDSFEEAESLFHERIAAREAEINAEKSVVGMHQTGGMIEARDIRVPGGLGRIFVYGRTRSYSMDGNRRIDDEWVAIDAYAHLNGLSFLLKMRYANESASYDAEAILGRLRLRPENSMPTESGFCIYRAIFIEPLPSHKTEHVVLRIGIPQYPDIAFSFNSMPGGGGEADLLARAANTDAEASFAEWLRVSKLRVGKRDINGLAGSEVLEKVRELNFATTYGFMWETPGIDADPMQPYISFEMQGGISARPGGQPRNTSLHEGAVMALWDSISSSIRLRPTGLAR